MGRNTLSHESYRRVADEAKAKGSATHAGAQRKKEGKGLHELVDPKGYGLIRRSIGPREEKNGFFELLRGLAMLEETRLDTTGSMGGNVEIAMRVLPHTYDLLAKVPNAVLRRYDVQMITSIFGDVVDDYVLCRSQAEMDERIAEQMTLMVPESGGGDFDEDPQYGLFGAAFLTDAEINRYGLKYYDFTVTDAPGRELLSEDTLIRVFGEQVFDKVKENGYDIDRNQIPKTQEIVTSLLQRAHAFVLLVGKTHSTVQFWEKIYGRGRVVFLPRTENLPEVKAAIIGLTEGVLTLDSLEQFLVDEGDMTASDAKAIVRSVSGIPIGAQMESENFDKIPLKGSLFAEKNSLWPVESVDVSEADSEEDSSDDSMWDK